MNRRHLVTGLGIAAAIGAAALTSPRTVPQDAPSVACGAARWSVKVLSDTQAGNVRLTPQRATVAGLRGLSLPTVIASTPRIEGWEFAVYRVQADLVGWKIEDDRDLHLVIAEPGHSEQTMIAEFPSDDCVGVRESAQRPAVKAARNALIASCGKPAVTYQGLRGTAVLTGVLFIDELHGQTGVAPNGVELHPVLGIHATCER